MANKIIHKHSSVVTNNQPKIPTESQLEYGEIAVNYADGYETISIKNSNNGIVTFKTSEYNDEKYAPKTHEHPEYVSKEYVDGVIEDNELVVAGALNEFNDSLTLKAEIDHNHDDVYSPIGHTHTKITNYGICETPGNDSQKVVTIEGFQREEGVQVRVKFTNAHTAKVSRIYLNVSETGNALITCNGSIISTATNSTNFYTFNNTDIYTFTFTYSGTTPYWVLEDKNPAINTASDNNEYPLIFTSSVRPEQAIAPGNKALYTDSANNMYYNPSSNTLTVANINGLASSATTATNATSATTATNANLVKINATSINANYPVILGPSTTANGTVSTGNKPLYTDGANNMYYNPSSNTLTVANINGLASSATTATSANTLNTSNTINGVKYTGAADVSNYVICTDSGSTFAKTVTHPNFKLVTGARVSVKFTNYQELSALDAITLKVGNTTAKGMYYKGEAITGANIRFEPSLIYDFIYDGTNWVLQGEWDVFSTAPITHGAINGITYDGISDISNYVICGTDADVIDKELKVPNIELTSGTVLYVKFTNGSITGRIRLKINGDSTNNVKLRGVSSFSLNGYNINNLDYYKFIFDGSVWWLMPNDIPVKVEISTANYNSTTSGNTLHTGVYYEFTSTASTSMNLTSIDSTTKQSFTMEITTGTSAPTITFPSTWKWVNGVFPVFEPNKTYQISTFNNCAVCASFSTASKK